jgi:hypothetical protein
MSAAYNSITDGYFTDSLITLHDGIRQVRRHTPGGRKNVVPPPVPGDLHQAACWSGVMACMSPSGGI